LFHYLKRIDGYNDSAMWSKVLSMTGWAILVDQTFDLPKAETPSSDSGRFRRRAANRFWRWTLPRALSPSVLNPAMRNRAVLDFERMIGPAPQNCFASKGTHP
jgi:hypothetical protein